MEGISPSLNSMSMTGPITCTIFPSFAVLSFTVLSFAVSAFTVPFFIFPTFLLFLSQCLHPADDLHHLLGDGTLARLVIHECQLLHHLLGVFRGSSHGRHPRPMLARP